MSAPLTTDDLRLSGVDAPRLAVAVSGGADSLCLTLLARDWAAAHGRTLVALTVDHGLRPEGRAEAERVAAWMDAWGVDHRILTWRGDKPSSAVQERARAARYALLVQAARDSGAGALLVGHHRNDQAETVRMRLGKGSGVRGLAGIAATSQMHGLPVLRPLLHVTKARMAATLENRGQAWIEDPSNQDFTYERVRARAGLSEGDVRALGALGDTAGALRRVVDLAAQALALKALGPEGLHVPTLRAAPPMLARQVLGDVLQGFRGAPYAPKRDKLARLLAWCLNARSGEARTLAGACLRVRDETLVITRERPRSTVARSDKLGYKEKKNGARAKNCPSAPCQSPEIDYI